MSFITEKPDDTEVPLCLAYTTDIDPYYRYTICKLVIRSRDTGKMKRTYFENLNVIATRLNVPSTIIAPFFAYCLSVSRQQKDPTSISGCFTKEVLNSVFKRFLRCMTLCDRCHLLETDICVRKKRGEVYLRCQACGHRTDLSRISEVPNRYLKYLLSSSVTMPRRKIDSTSSKATSSKKSKRSPREKEEVTWLADTSDEAVSRRLELSNVSTVDRLLS